MINGVDEQALLKKAQAGDKAALNTIITNYWAVIYKFIIIKIHNHDDAQELTQEAFMRAIKALPNFNITGVSFKTFLGKIALNLVYDFWRKTGRRPSLCDIGDFEKELVDNRIKPEEAVICTETEEQMLALLKQLPQEQRRTIELRIIAGLSIKETADILKKSEAAVKMLQQRALKNLQSLCARNGMIKNIH